MSRLSTNSDLSVIVPYREFENLINAGKRIEEMEKKYKFMEEKYVAMMELYREILEKVAETNRYL